MAAGLPRPLITLAVLFAVLCGSLTVPGAITISRGQPRPSVIHHSPRPDHELEMQDAGGAPDGGEVESVVFTAGESPILYASFSAGAVFRSADLGRTWAPADRGLPQTTPCDLAADPQRGGILYAACIGQLFKTLDGGSRWQQLDVDDAELPVIAPSDSRVIYQPAGGMVSGDRGSSWRVRPRRGGEWQQTPVVAVDPADPQHLVAASDAGVEHSRDGGIHWSVLNSGLAPARDAQALAIAPVDRRVMIVRTWEATYRTDDGGTHWIPIGSPLPPANVTRMRFDGDTVDVLTVLNQDDLLRSADGGASWMSLSDTLRRPVTAWATHPSTAAIVVAGTKRGVFVTRDHGATWGPAFAGIRRASATVFVGDGPRPPLYARVDDELLASDDAGRTWIAASDSKAAEATTPAVMDPRDPDVVFALTYGEIIDGGATLARSTDAGLTWTGMIGPGGSIHHFAVVATTPTTAFALASTGGSRKLYRSADHGTNWTRAGKGLPDDIALTSIVALPGDPVRLLAGTIGRGVFESLDGGATWQPLP